MDRLIHKTPGSRLKGPFLSAIALAVVVMSALGLWTWSVDRSDATDGAWSKAARGDLQIAARGAGEFISSGQRKYSARESGMVDSVLKNVGDRIEQGDVVVVLDNPQLMQEFEEAQIEQRSKKIEADEAAGHAEQEIERARLAVEQARIDQAVVESERVANESLLQRGIISRFTYDQVAARLAQKQLTLRAAERLFDLARSLQAKQKAARAESLRLAESRVGRMERRLKSLEVTSEETSVIKALNVRRGDVVAAGASLFVAGPDAPDRARVLFPQRYLSDLKIGVPVVLSVQGKEVHGRIESVAADVVNGQVVTVVMPEHIPDDARIDMAVRAEAKLQVLNDVVYIPSTLEIPRGQDKAQVRLRRAGSEVARTLDGVRSVDGFLVFDNGVQAGDMVIVENRL